MDAKAFIGALSSRLAGIRSRRRGLVSERLQERLELSGASLDDCSQIGARHRDPGHLKRPIRRRSIRRRLLSKREVFRA